MNSAFGELFAVGTSAANADPLSLNSPSLASIKVNEEGHTRAPESRIARGYELGQDLAAAPNLMVGQFP